MHSTILPLQQLNPCCYAVGIDGTPLLVYERSVHMQFLPGLRLLGIRNGSLLKALVRLYFKQVFAPAESSTRLSYLSWSSIAKLTQILLHWSDAPLPLSF